MSIYANASALGGDGSKENPIGNLSEAIKLARRDSDRKVILSGGIYYDTELVFTSQDSGLTLEAAEGETVLLSGASKLSGIKRDGKFFVAPIPGSGDRTRDFRMLEVNGEYRPRARIPETGALSHLNTWTVPWLSSIAGGWARKPTEEELTTLCFKEGDIPSTTDPKNAEVTVYHEWDETLCAVSDIDFEQGKIRFANPAGHPPGAFMDRNKNATTYVLWNTAEGMTQEGNWYLDRTHERLVYFPKAGETPENIEILAPSKEQILVFEEGTENITIRGITLCSCAAQLKTGGYGAHRIDGAVVGNGKNLTFEGVQARNLSGWAFKVRGDGMKFIGCHIHHLGAGAISFQGEGVVIRECRIHDVGLVHQSAVAVTGGGKNNLLCHNEIYNTPYCGINNFGQHSTAEYNLFYNIKDFMQDGGAIYAFGADHVTMRGNVVIYPPENERRINAYYYDETSKDSTAEGNLAVNSHSPVLAHMASGCHFKNNIFLDHIVMKLHGANSSNMEFERNVLIAPEIVFEFPDGNKSGATLDYEPVEIMKPYSLATGIKSYQNCVISAPRNKVIFSERLQYRVVKQYPLPDRDGIVFDDPKLIIRDNGDIDFEKDSPCIPNGIKPLDTSKAGCTGRVGQLLREIAKLQTKG